MEDEFVRYHDLLSAIKTRIRGAQVKAALSANQEMLFMYWDIGRMIDQRQRTEGWGAAVIPRLARDILNELPEIRGFSERNLKRMVRFFREYPFLAEIVPQSVAQMADEKKTKKVPQAVAQIPHDVKENLCRLIPIIPWGHNFLLMEKIKDPRIRLWYMQEVVAQGWSRNVLVQMITNQAHERQGGALTNFKSVLPSPQSDLAAHVLKDPYIFDFLTIEKPFRERELELCLLEHLERFLIELGKGFAFVGRQYHIAAGDDDFYIDLLFYHLGLRCFVVIDLKMGPFKPEYAGKMNFYLNLVDDRLKHENDNPSIGLILCQDKRKIIAEYALRGLNKPMSVSEYQLTQSLPDDLRSSLPSIEEIEKELSDGNSDEKEKI
ncbi:MAG: DUF1016 domain-containing protein [Thermoplasmata archaeon]|nr:MAG: DUF1016 domain-containing protein [Thermoplasmata archaeon]